MKFLKQNLIPFSVFFTGASVLIIEITATRILSPYFGNTIFTVSSIISVILGSLSLGYYVGGRMSERYPSLKWFFGMIAMSGIILLITYLIGVNALQLFGYNLSITNGPLITSVIMFFLPTLFLGTLSPYAIKLQFEHFPKDGIGRVSGKIFFLSTAGSILGSLLSGFVLIPSFGIKEIVFGNGVFLFVLGFLPLLLMYKKKRFFLINTAIVLGVITTLLFSQDRRIPVVYQKNGIYEQITVQDSVENGRPVRYFIQDKSLSGAMYLDSTDPHDLVENYTKYYSLYKVFTPQIKNALVIGGGAYSIPKVLHEDLPDARIDVSEIEPSLYDLAIKYFNLPKSPNIRNFTDDGRRFLHDSKIKYDLIFSDVYYSLFSIPIHFTTQEFFQLGKSNLDENGIFVANLIGDLSPKNPSLLLSEMKTFRIVFPNSYFFAVDSNSSSKSQNVIFVGYNSEKKIDFHSTDTALSGIDTNIVTANKIIDPDKFDFSQYPVLTDNYSPIEYLTGQVLQKTFSEKSLTQGELMLESIREQVSFGPRYPSAPGHKKVQDFIYSSLNNVAHTVQLQTWVHTELSGNSYSLTNIIARFYPDQKDRLLLATHYDSQKISFKDAMNITIPSPGANNSASGVSVLINLAHLLKNTDKVPHMGVDFVFFDGEEGEENQGGDFTNWKPLGSTYFATHLSDYYQDTKPTQGIVLDMVCDKNLTIPIEKSSLQSAPTQTRAFWQSAQNISKAFNMKIGQEIRDDHTSLNAMGIPSFLIIDFDYPHYATSKDTVDNCSAESLLAVSRAVWNYIYPQVY